jgi:hypothetical protein
VVDVSTVCERLAERFLQAAALLKRGEGEEEDIFTKCHRWAKKLGEKFGRGRAGVTDGNVRHDDHEGSGEIRGAAGDGVADAAGFSMSAGPGLFDGVSFTGPVSLGLFQISEGWLGDIFQVSWD